MPFLYRICKTKHAATAFDGEGARLYGGRWNSVGSRVVYAAGSLSLTILEILVHLDYTPILPSYSYIRVKCAAEYITNVNDIALLPSDWYSSPPPKDLQQIGDHWLKNLSSAVLTIPSAVVPTEWNYLINPAHADFALLEIDSPKPLTFDPRLIR